MRDLAELADTLVTQGDALRAEHAGRHLCVRVVLVGRGALADEMLRRDGADDLLEDVRARHGELDPFLWWAEIEHRTRPSIDVDALRGGEDFEASVIAVADEICADEDERRALAESVLDGLPRRLWPALGPVFVRSALEEALTHLQIPAGRP